MPAPTLSLDLLGVPAAVETPDAPLVRSLEELLRDLPRTSMAPDHRIRLEPAGGESVDVYDGERRRESGISRAEAITVSLWLLNQWALTSRRYAVVHAGCVSRAGAGVVLCAASGSGKSTLVTTLVEQGWGYLSDEFAALSLDEAHLCPSPTPIGLKDGAFGLFPHLRPAPWEIHDESRWHIPADRLRHGSTSGSVPPAAVFLTRYEAGTPCSATLIDPDEALLRLLDQTLNLGVLGGRAFRALARLAVSVPAWELRYGDTASATIEIERLCCLSGAINEAGPQLARLADVVAQPAGAPATWVQSQ